MSDWALAKLLRTLVDEASLLDLKPTDVLALERAIFLLEESGKKAK